MSRIPIIDDDTEDQAALGALQQVQDAWGQPWNIIRAMAHNPAIVEGFLALHAALGRSGLSKQDREVICMEMACQNGCHYCVPAHRFATAHEGVDQALIERIAQGETLAGDDRPALLQKLVRRMVETKGKLADEEFQRFQEAGFDNSQMIAVVAEIAHCTLTNTFNRLAETEIDAMLEPYAKPFA